MPATSSNSTPETRNLELVIKNADGLVLAVTLHPYCCTDIALELISRLVDVAAETIIEVQQDDD